MKRIEKIAWSCLDPEHYSTSFKKRELIPRISWAYDDYLWDDSPRMEGDDWTNHDCGSYYMCND